MKKITATVQFMVYTTLLTMFGCVADPEFENAQSVDEVAPATRAQSEGKYYYAFDERVPLNEVAGRVVVTFEKGHRSGEEQYSTRNSLTATESFEIRDGYSGEYSVVGIKGKSDKNMSKNSLLKQTGVKSVRQVYALEDGYEMGYTNEVILQFKKSVSQQKIDEMHKKFGVEVIKTTELYVLLSVPVGSDPLDVANAYQESGLTNYSHPNFITTIGFSQSLPTDQYFTNQFYLRNTGQGVNGRTSTAGADINVVPAWNITKGSPNIVVAVIDEGVTSNHPDLPNTRQVRLNGSNFGNGNPNDPSPTGNDNHGNACAGIIGASHNGEGIAGIAPGCKILPVRTAGAMYISDCVDAIKFAANNADIISCSWALLDVKKQRLSSDPNLYPTVVDAIRYATTSGKRGSKGSVVVFSAGNTANRVHGDNGFIAFPANVNISGVLTVGAVDRNGQQANYSPTSNWSSSQNQIIDVVAPSHKAYSTQISTETMDVWSIDIPGTAGYNPTQYDKYDIDDASKYYGRGFYMPNSGTNHDAYTGLFGGTSAACPQVAGIAALILSKSPNLTQQQVSNIIMATASNTNWNNKTGYGLVNAHKAILADAPQAPATPIINIGAYSLTSLEQFQANIPSPAYWARPGGQVTVYVSNYDSAATYEWDAGSYPISLHLDNRNVWDITMPPNSPGFTRTTHPIRCRAHKYDKYSEWSITHWLYISNSRPGERFKMLNDTDDEETLNDVYLENVDSVDPDIKTLRLLR